ncbi:xanthine dehydrogenase family protein molybdopterin-binding subunit [soil metagenome]
MNETGQGIVGKPLHRVDGKLKVTGGARYAAEFPVANVAHAVLVQSHEPKGKITAIDATAAKAVPGVLTVITHENQGETGKSPLLPDEIAYSGQTYAVVVAETLEAATHAAALVKLTLDAQPPQADYLKLLDTVTGGRPPQKRGDPDAGLAASAKRIDAVYTTPTEHHNPMEPHATVAVWENGGVTVYDATQGVSGTAGTVAGRMGIDAKAVHVIDPFVGGGFGCKGNSWPHTSIAALAARQVGRPVKLALTRRQMFTSNGHRPPTHQQETFAAGMDGKLTAILHEGRCRAAQKDGFVESTGVAHPVLYACANLSVEDRPVHADMPPGTYMRAPGEASGTFGMETAMDELAYALGLDPLELRLRNYAETDPSNGKPWSSKSLRECYAQASERFGWSRRTPEPGSMKKDGMLVGMGMATATYPSNFWPANARATIDDTGKVLIQCGTQDLGTGTYTILTQIAAEALGIDPKVVRVEIGDSTLPQAPVSGGSCSAASAGSAVKLAAQALRAKLVEAGAGDYAATVKKSGAKTMSVEASAAPDLDSRKYSSHGFGAQFCEVHIDPDLRMVRVARWVGAFALGKILNEKTLRSQLYGGIVWGIGMGLLEETVVDPRYGRFLNSNLAEYHVPVNKDVPDIDVIMIPEEDLHFSPVGAKGAGEIGITGASAALGNAVYHATGKRVRDLPITLDKIL